MAKKRSHLTDNEILRLNFEYGDPRERHDLLNASAVPDNPVWIDFIERYDTKKAIQCMRPTCGVWHNDGAVVQIEDRDGTVGMINIGHNCGEELFPEHFKVGRQTFDHDMRRKRLVESKRGYLARERDVMAWFEITRERFAFYDDYRSKFEALMPDLLAVIRNAIRSQNGELRTYHYQSQSAFKEALRTEGYNFRDDATYTVEHIVAGQLFFSPGGLVGKSNKTALECENLFSRLRPDNLFVSEMQECIAGLVGIAGKMERMHFQYRDTFDALSPGQLQAFERWSHRNDDNSPYEYRDGGLFRYADGSLPEYFLKLEQDVRRLPMEAFPLSRAA